MILAARPHRSTPPADDPHHATGKVCTATNPCMHLNLHGLAWTATRCPTAWLTSAHPAAEFHPWVMSSGAWAVSTITSITPSLLRDGGNRQLSLHHSSGQPRGAGSNGQWYRYLRAGHASAHALPPETQLRFSADSSGGLDTSCPYAKAILNTLAAAWGLLDGRHLTQQLDTGILSNSCLSPTSWSKCTA